MREQHRKRRRSSSSVSRRHRRRSSDGQQGQARRRYVSPNDGEQGWRRRRNVSPNKNTRRLYRPPEREERRPFHQSPPHHGPRPRRHSSSSSSSSSRRHDTKSHRRKRSPTSSRSSSSSVSYSGSVGSSTIRRRRTPHFRYKNGQIIGYKYKITRLLGEGTFGRVVEAYVLNKHGHRQERVAIKIIRPVPKYVESAKTERSILRRLMELDRRDEQRLVRYIQSFDHYNHFCLVFRPLGKSLYEVIKRNAYEGFPIKLVRSFAEQIFSSIGFLHRCKYTHTDLKPQNILLQSDEMVQVKHPTVSKYYLPVSEGIRIIDFGSATHHDQHHSSVINTRQYRSPEVLLECCEWDQVSDVWSIGCILVELYTGELLFQTHEDGQHLMMIAKNSGPIPLWMGTKCSNSLRKFFKHGLMVPHALSFLQDTEPFKEFKTIRELFQGEGLFLDLLKKCLEIDPEKRISCREALLLPFFQKGV